MRKCNVHLCVALTSFLSLTTRVEFKVVYYRAFDGSSAGNFYFEIFIFLTMVFSLRGNSEVTDRY